MILRIRCNGPRPGAATYGERKGQMTHEELGKQSVATEVTRKARTERNRRKAEQAWREDKETLGIILRDIQFGRMSRCPENEAHQEMKEPEKRILR